MVYQVEIILIEDKLRGFSRNVKSSEQELFDV